MEHAFRSGKYRHLLVLAVAILLGLIIFMGVELKDVNRDIHRSLIDRAAHQARMAIELFPEPIAKNLLAAQKGGKAGEVAITDIPSLNDRFIPILRQYHHIAAVMVACAEGREYQLRKDGEAIVSRQTNPQAWGAKLRFKRFADTEAPVKEWTEELAYDPRQRPWYKGAVEKKLEGGIHWTSPYRFFTGGVPGITASVSWEDAKSGRTVVTAFDVFLSEVMDFMDTIRFSENSKVFLIDEDETVSDIRLVSLNRNHEIQAKGIDAPTPGVDAGVVSLAVEQWRKERSHGDISFHINSAGKTWWAGFRPLAIEAQKFWLGVLVPEGELMPEMKKRRYLVFYTLIGALVLAVLLTVFFLRRNRPPLDDLFSRRNRYQSDQALRSLIKRGESGELEFKSTMRWNLKTDKAGKEIELAWLKTVAAYLNTDGGILLIGVKDDGTIGGIEADRFQNDDKCLLHFNNLISQHIGLEFSTFIHFEIRPVDDKKILIVECAASLEPVFLKNQKNEAFYIRSGPSSQDLPMSKVLKYLEERKTN